MFPGLVGNKTWERAWARFGAVSMSAICSGEPGGGMTFGFLPFDQNRDGRGSSACPLFAGKCCIDFLVDPQFLHDLHSDHSSEELWKPRLDWATRKWDQEVEMDGEKAGGESALSVLEGLRGTYPTQSFEFEARTAVDKKALKEMLALQELPFTLAFTACSAKEPKASSSLPVDAIDVSGCHTFAFLVSDHSRPLVVDSRTFVVDSHKHDAGGLFVLSMPTDLMALVDWLYDRGLELLGISTERAVDLVFCKRARVEAGPQGEDASAAPQPAEQPGQGSVPSHEAPIDLELDELALIRSVAPFYSWQCARSAAQPATYCLLPGDFLPASCDYGNALLKEFLSVGLKLRSLQLHFKQSLGPAHTYVSTSVLQQG